MYPDNRSMLAPAARPTLAVACLGLGVVGLVLPLIPGIPFLIVGALLLRRRGRGTTSPAPIRSHLSGAERLQLQFWLLARRVTTSAESIRLARLERARRVRQRDY
jgi:hypothetical protein